MFSSPIVIQPVQKMVGMQSSFGVMVIVLLIFAAVHLLLGYREANTRR